MIGAGNNKQVRLIVVNFAFECSPAPVGLEARRLGE